MVSSVIHHYCWDRLDLFYLFYDETSNFPPQIMLLLSWCNYGFSVAHWYAIDLSPTNRIQWQQKIIDIGTVDSWSSKHTSNKTKPEMVVLVIDVNWFTIGAHCVSSKVSVAHFADDHFQMQEWLTKRNVTKSKPISLLANFLYFSKITNMKSKENVQSHWPWTENLVFVYPKLPLLTVVSFVVVWWEFLLFGDNEITLSVSSRSLWHRLPAINVVEKSKKSHHGI